MNQTVAALLVVLLLCIALPVRAQEAVVHYALPDTLVVTASREAEDVRLTGRRVTVWTARDVAALPVSSFDELLRTVGGVEAFSRNGFGVQSDLTMRGSTFNGVLLLLDGVRLNDPMTGHFLTDFPVPLAEIARIEVLRGPATALYGPDALGGVIQVFTYSGLRGPGMAASGFEGSGTLKRGAFNLYDLDAAVRFAGARSALSFASALQASDGMPVRGEDGQVVRGSNGEVRTDFSRQTHSAAFVQALRRATLFARVGLDDRDFGAYRFYTPFASDTAREATTTYWAQARLQGDPAAPTRWTLALAAKQHEDTYIYNPQTPANEHTSSLLSLQAQMHRTLNPSLILGAGGSASYRDIDSNNMGRHDDATAGGYLTTRWLPAPRLALNASGRLDYDPGFGLEATPQVSAAYNLPRLTLRAGVARAVRAPNYVERYFNTTLARPRGRDLGNPDLQAERAWSYEAGLDAYPTEGLSLHATAFSRTTDDLIDFVKLAPEDTVFLARNVLSVRTNGLELDADARRMLGPNRLRLAATYTWLDAELRDETRAAAYKYVLTNARHLVQGQAALDTGPATLAVQGLWKSPLEGDAYGVVNVRVAYRLNLGRQHLVLSGELRNLFDHAYAEVFNAPMPGRWWLFGVRFGR